MRRRFFLLAAASVLVMACGGEGSGGGGEGDRGAQARQRVADGATLLDVRTPGEWSAGHLEGAMHIPVSELSSRMSEVPTDAPVVVYCLSGVRSARAAQMLEAEGYEVFDLGSMAAWGAE